MTAFYRYLQKGSLMLHYPQRFEKHRKWFLALAWAGIAAVAALSVAAGIPMVRFASQPEKFRDWIASNGVWGDLAFVGMVMLQILIAVIPGEPFEIAAGYAFGAWEGTVLYLLASTLGSMGVFFLVRRFGRPLVELLFPPEKLRWLRFLKTNPKRELLFLLVFMLPGTPKDLLCYFAGLTDIRIPVWLVICSLGRIPSVITSTLGGDALGERNYTFAILVFAVSLAVSAGGLWLFHRICARRERKK